MRRIFVPLLVIAACAKAPETASTLTTEAAFAGVHFTSSHPDRLLRWDVVLVP